MNEDKNTATIRIMAIIMNTAYQMAAKDLNIPVTALRTRLASYPEAERQKKAHTLFIAINKAAPAATTQEALIIAALPRKEAEDHIRFFARPLADALTLHLGS
ncbi:MAG: hypothetical protein PHW63_02465 [Alphaproteobacteria bacterium]|nr:hypothetical protein [Alphaproteobacteria bacterium]